jgi:hypothetical protein
LNRCVGRNWVKKRGYYPVFNTKKFAGLIVRECISVHEDDYGVNIIGDVLKKHFGVEE